MSSNRPTPNRRRREVDPAEEARIEAFAQQAETLRPASIEEPTPTVQEKLVIPQVQGVSTAEDQPKIKSYTFRMTEATLEKLRAAAAVEDRSIQWVFDKVLLKALDK